MNALPRLPWAWIWPLLLALLAGPAHAQAALKPVPPLRTRVTDEVGMLTPGQRGQLEAALADYQAKTGSQIAVLLVASTAPEAIEQYGIRVADAWKLGRKGVDDGVLLLVAKDNPKALRRLRIEAGRGVQGVLTDAQSKRILEDTIAPRFGRQDWYGGLRAGVGAIEGLLDQEALPAPQRHASARGAGYAVLAVFALVGLIFIVVGFIVFRARKRSRRKARPARRARRAAASSDGTPTFAIGSASADDDGGSGDSSDTSGGGGTFDGGGASGDWDD